MLKNTARNHIRGYNWSIGRLCGVSSYCVLESQWCTRYTPGISVWVPNPGYWTRSAGISFFRQQAHSMDEWYCVEIFFLIFLQRRCIGFPCSRRVPWWMISRTSCRYCPVGDLLATQPVDFRASCICCQSRGPFACKILRSDAGSDMLLTTSLRFKYLLGRFLWS